MVAFGIERRALRPFANKRAGLLDDLLAQRVAEGVEWRWRDARGVVQTFEVLEVLPRIAVVLGNGQRHATPTVSHADLLRRHLVPDADQLAGRRDSLEREG